MNLFIDTNIFLSFFHLTSDDLEELKKLSVFLDSGDIYLLLPEQVIYEFRRNRENKIFDSLKRLKNQTLNLQFPQICKDYEEYEHLRELQNQYSRFHSILIDKITQDVATHNLKADIIIKELFDKSILIKSTNEIITNAKLRLEIGNPPGKNGSLGDAINWEAILSHVNKGEDVYFVTDDKDYYSKLNSNKFNEFLLAEWDEKKQSNIYYYRRISTFFNEHFPDIRFANELEKEILIRQLARSSSFAETHSVIGRLSKYPEFTDSQLNDIIEAVLSNNQIYWIIQDEDVKKFVTSVINGNEDKINEESLKKVAVLLTENNNSTNDDLFDFTDELPF